VLIFRSPILWHAVAPWKPNPMAEGATLTPGRVSLVFFTRKEVVDRAKDWPKGYGMKTAYGQMDALAEEPLCGEELESLSDGEENSN